MNYGLVKETQQYQPQYQHAQEEEMMHHNMYERRRDNKANEKHANERMHNYLNKYYGHGHEYDYRMYERRWGYSDYEEQRMPHRYYASHQYPMKEGCYEDPRGYAPSSSYYPFMPFMNMRIMPFELNINENSLHMIRSNEFVHLNSLGGFVKQYKGMVICGVLRDMLLETTILSVQIIGNHMQRHPTQILPEDPYELMIMPVKVYKSGYNRYMTDYGYAYYCGATVYYELCIP